MDVLFTHGAGLDVHNKRVTAWRVSPDPTGQQAEGMMAVKGCGTMPRDLLALADWLPAVGVTHVAMESPGEYWRPVENLLEGDLTVCLVNAAHVTQGPGRKTDKNDARWRAQLMRYGLGQASVIPPQGQREWRELTRSRAKRVQERRREGNRVRGVLERAKITLAAVATESMGVSGRTLRGRFGTASRLAACTGVAPGHDESAGEQRSGKTRKGSRVLRTALTQLAHAAARTQGTSLSALYQRLAARRGRKRAIIAVAHAMVVSAFHLLSRHEPYQELGSHYFDEQRRHHLVHRLTRRLEPLGYRVNLELGPATA